MREAVLLSVAQSWPGTSQINDRKIELQRERFRSQNGEESDIKGVYDYFTLPLKYKLNSKLPKMFKRIDHFIHHPITHTVQCKHVFAIPWFGLIFLSYNANLAMIFKMHTKIIL